MSGRFLTPPHTAVLVIPLLFPKHAELLFLLLPASGGPGGGEMGSDGRRRSRGAHD